MRAVPARRLERAAERERARIARDMHDVLAHAVSLMVVQAEAGPVVVRGDPDRAEATFDAVAASAPLGVARGRGMRSSRVVIADDRELVRAGFA
ncbi:histidine kinase [Nonomuraea sp. NPDC004354]